MPTFYYVVRVDTDTQDHADQVIAERTGYDEDLGFDYTIDYTEQPVLPEEGATA